MALPIRSDRRTQQVAWTTIALILVNVVVFLFVQPTGFQNTGDPATAESRRLVRDAEEFSYEWGSVPCEITGGKVLADRPSGCEGEQGSTLPPTKSILLALLTTMFLHGSILHLGGNMLFLWVFGKNVEERLGPPTFLALYLLGGILATLGFVVVNQHAAVPLIGASGAIAVAMGAYLVLYPRTRVLTIIATVAFQVVYVPAGVVLILFFVTQFFTGDDQVAWEAHAVGMAVGCLATLALARLPAVRRREAADAEADRLRLGTDF